LRQRFPQSQHCGFAASVRLLFVCVFPERERLEQAPTWCRSHISKPACERVHTVLVCKRVAEQTYASLSPTSTSSSVRVRVRGMAILVTGCAAGDRRREEASHRRPDWARVSERLWNELTYRVVSFPQRCTPNPDRGRRTLLYVALSRHLSQAVCITSPGGWLRLRLGPAVGNHRPHRARRFLGSTETICGWKKNWRSRESNPGPPLR
jgi:hypothetical protein